MSKLPDMPRVQINNDMAQMLMAQSPHKAMLNPMLHFPLDSFDPDPNGIGLMALAGEDAIELETLVEPLKKGQDPIPVLEKMIQRMQNRLGDFEIAGTLPEKVQTHPDAVRKYLLGKGEFP